MISPLARERCYRYPRPLPARARSTTNRNGSTACRSIRSSRLLEPSIRLFFCPSPSDHTYAHAHTHTSLHPSKASSPLPRAMKTLIVLASRSPPSVCISLVSVWTTSRGSSPFPGDVRMAHLTRHCSTMHRKMSDRSGPVEARAIFSSLLSFVARFNKSRRKPEKR